MTGQGSGAEAGNPVGFAPVLGRRQDVPTVAVPDPHGRQVVIRLAPGPLFGKDQPAVIGRPWRVGA